MADINFCTLCRGTGEAATPYEGSFMYPTIQPCDRCGGSGLEPDRKPIVSDASVEVVVDKFFEEINS